MRLLVLALLLVALIGAASPAVTSINSLPLRLQVMALMLKHVFPGQTMYSLERMPECGTDPAKPTCKLDRVCKKKDAMVCNPPFYAASKQSWVRFESPQAGALRYELIANALVTSAEKLLCKGAFADPKCKPLRWSPQGRKNRGSIEELVRAGMTAGLLESGFREDVQTGRGRAKHPVDLGEGRGPANEVCLMQIMTGMACKFAPGLSPEDRIRCLNDADYREEVAQMLLGEDFDSVERCFETGLRMLAKSRNQCEWEMSFQKPIPNWREPSESWMFRMYSYYGTGRCGAVNAGKTGARFRMYLTLSNTATPVPSFVEEFFVYRGLVPAKI